ncbi:MAG: hypothetical protein EBV77_05545 [Gemmatimonadaceae bacterium]|nr:hypothetical protein [Gemmatimonadaceae bacterium]
MALSAARSGAPGTTRKVTSAVSANRSCSAGRNACTPVDPVSATTESDIANDIRRGVRDGSAPSQALNHAATSSATSATVRHSRSKRRCIIA